MRTIYLDYNATTPIAPRVQQAILPFLAEHFGNPSSGHSLGRASSEALADARGRVASLLGAESDQILFTSGGTESNNLAIRGVMLADQEQSAGHLIISNIEHPATIEPARYLESLGFQVTTVAADPQGVVRPEAVRNAIRPNTRLVSIMHANNEIGTIQPIRQIADICREHGVLMHTDAAQSVGKIPTLVKELGVDLLSMAGHKVYAPKGIGALYIRPGTPITRILHGAGQEFGIRPGTENVAFAVALGEAATLARESHDESHMRLENLRNRLATRLVEGIGESLSINGGSVDRLPNTLSVNFPKVSGAELLRRTPEICASTGAACHSGQDNLSNTLAAIGLSGTEARGTVRLSLGWFTEEEEVDRAADLLLAAWESLA